MKKLLLIWVTLCSTQLSAQTTFEQKSYTTEFGRFDLWIQETQVTGAYEIAPKKVLGSMWATLEGLKATGRWKDADGEGDIILTFEDGLERFKADYRTDDQPDKWYRDQWHGQLIAPVKHESSCATESHQLIRPFIGTWEEFELDDKDQENFIGTLNVELVAGDCALAQRFESPDSSFSYATQGYVNPGSGFWEETYVFSTGNTAEYQWIVDNGDVVQRRIGGTRKIDYLHQLRFTQVTAAGYLVTVEQSTDGGKSWATKERTRVKRVR